MGCHRKVKFSSNYRRRHFNHRSLLEKLTIRYLCYTKRTARNRNSNQLLFNAFRLAHSSLFYSVFIHWPIQAICNSVNNVLSLACAINVYLNASNNIVTYFMKLITLQFVFFQKKLFTSVQ